MSIGNAISGGMAYAASLVHTNEVHDGLQLSKVSEPDGSKCWWHFPELPLRAKSGVEKTFQTADSAVHFYKHFVCLIREIEPEYLKLVEWVESHKEIKGQPVFALEIEIENCGDGNDYYPHLDQLTDFKANVGLLWGRSFRASTAKEVIKKLEDEVIEIERLQSLKENPSEKRKKIQIQYEEVEAQVKILKKKLDKTKKFSRELEPLKKQLQELTDLSFKLWREIQEA